MAKTLCPCCGSDSTTPYLSCLRDYLLPPTSERWDIRRCTDCGIGFTFPPPKMDRIASYYPPEYVPYHVAVAERGALKTVLRKVTIAPYRLRHGDPDWVPVPTGAGRALDIGCGSGAQLRILGEHGWRCWGIDFTADAVAAAQRNNPNANIRQCILEDYAPDVLFDLITIRHVLEHLPDPVGTLKRCHALMVDGGRIVVEVPNFESAEARLFRSRWAGWEIPRHLVHFSEASLVRMLAHVGFSVERTRPVFFARSISESLLRCVADPFGRSIFYNRISRLAFLLLAVPASMSYLVGNRGVIEVVARRPDAP